MPFVEKLSNKPVKKMYINGANIWTPGVIVVSRSAGLEYDKSVGLA